LRIVADGSVSAERTTVAAVAMSATLGGNMGREKFVGAGDGSQTKGATTTEESGGLWAHFLDLAGGDERKAVAFYRKAMRRRTAPNRDLTDAEAAAGKERKPRVVDGLADVGEGEGMLVLEDPGSHYESIKARQRGRIEQADRLARVAVERFESILRKREAEPALQKGFGDVAQTTVQGWFRDNLQRAFPSILPADLQDVTLPVGFKDVPVIGTLVAKIGDGLEGQAKANQAERMLDAVDQLVLTTREGIEKTTADARERLERADQAALLDLDRRTDEQRPPITSSEIDELIAKLDAMLSRHLLDMGGITSSEYLERLKQRKHLNHEIDEARKKHPSKDETE
jgi:hypothetical protein